MTEGSTRQDSRPCRASFIIKTKLNLKMLRKKNKKGNWELEAIFALVGLILLGDIFITKLLPMNDFLQFVFVAVFISLAIWIKLK